MVSTARAVTLLVSLLPLTGQTLPVAAVPLPVCEIQFLRATPATIPDLNEAAKPLIGQPYSREGIAIAIETSVIDVYRRQARWRVAFMTPQATPMSSPTCPSGVLVKVPVEEGPVFKLKVVTWIGNTVFTAAELDAAASALKIGDRADSTKLATATAAVVRMYAQRGYIEFFAGPSFEFDYAQAQASLTFDAHEGPAYTMGTVTIVGAAPEQTRVLQKAWPIKTGSPFDMTAIRDFLRTASQSGLLAASGQPDSTLKPDHVAHIVDIVLTIK